MGLTTFAKKMLFSGIAFKHDPENKQIVIMEDPIDIKMDGFPDATAHSEFIMHAAHDSGVKLAGGSSPRIMRFANKREKI